MRVVLAPAPPTQWFPCPHCRTPVPVVVPREPPPLYSWEVFPGLYPALPSPRRPRRRAYWAAGVALLVVALFAAGFAAVLVYDAWQAARPASFVVDGTVGRYVDAGFEPLAGATVTLTNEENRSTTLVTGFEGTFLFSSVPPGGVTLNVSAPGYAPLSVTTFVSSVYAAPSTDLDIALTPGSPENASTVALAPFPDLEQFEASIGSGAVLLGIVVVVAGAAALATMRDERPALGVVGGAAGLVSPLVMYFLSLSVAFPLLTGATAVLAAAGAFALVLRAVRLTQSGPAAD